MMENRFLRWTHNATWKNYLAAIIVAAFTIGGFGGLCLIVLVSMGVDGLLWILGATAAVIGLTASLIWAACNLDAP